VRRQQLLLTILLACASVPARAAVDAEEPRQPPPPPAAPLDPTVALSFTLRSTTLIGVDLALFPTERLQVGGEFGSCLLVSEAGVYTRYAVVHGRANDLTLGARLAGVTSIVGPDDQSPTHTFASIEAGYEHRNGASLLAIEIGTAVWADDGTWFPASGRAITGGVRFGHLW
jgi:hypothetical protein